MTDADRVLVSITLCMPGSPLLRVEGSGVGVPEGIRIVILCSLCNFTSVPQVFVRVIQRLYCPLRDGRSRVRYWLCGCKCVAGRQDCISKVFGVGSAKVFGVGLECRTLAIMLATEDTGKSVAPASVTIVLRPRNVRPYRIWEA